MTSPLFPTHVLPSDPTLRLCGNEIRENQGADPGWGGGLEEHSSLEVLCNNNSAIAGAIPEPHVCSG